MKPLMRQSLIRCLVVVAIAGGVLLLLDSAPTSTPQASLTGDQPAFCADDWMSLDDPEALLGQVRIEPGEVGGHPPFRVQPTASAPSFSSLTHPARGPPVC